MLFVLGSMLLGIWLTSGRDLYYLDVAAGRSPAFSRMFSGHTVLARRMGLIFLYVISVAIFVVPAVVIGLAVGGITGDEDAGGLAGLCVGVVSGGFFVWMLLVYGAAWFVPLDQDVGVMECLRVSRRITAGNRLTLLGVYILGVVLMVAGLCAFILGVFVTTPLAYFLYIVAYMQMSGQRVAGASYVISQRERALPALPNV